MTISQLIEKLQAIQAEHGNLPVLYADVEQGHLSVDRVKFYEAGTNQWTGQSFPATVVLAVDGTWKDDE